MNAMTHYSFRKKNPHAGFGLLEIVVAVSIISATLFGLATVSRIAFRSVHEASNSARASFLLEETFEAIKMMRDQNWADFSSLALNQSYSIVFENGIWSAATPTDTLIDNLFKRTFILREVFRNPEDDIAVSGVSDPDTRRVEITVKWNERGRDRSTSAITYIANIFLE